MTVSDRFLQAIDSSWFFLNNNQKISLSLLLFVTLFLYCLLIFIFVFDREVQYVVLMNIASMSVKRQVNWRYCRHIVSYSAYSCECLLAVVNGFNSC